MRHSRATGRHGPYHSPVPVRAALAAVAALVLLISAVISSGAVSIPAAAQAGHARVARHLTAVVAAITPFRDRVAPHAVLPVTPALRLYVVRAGDTMSGVAAAMCGQARDWTGIYAASRAAHLTAADANLLRIGQSLAVSCSYQPAELRYAGDSTVTLTTWHRAASGGTAAASSGSYGHPYFCGDGDGDGWDMPCQHAVSSWVAPSPVTYSGSSSFQSCVIARESGGNPQVMNSSGHYGLYQFSASTWAAYGGNPADFGHASAAEQTRVFDSAMSQPGGASNWAPYDGC